MSSSFLTTVLGSEIADKTGRILSAVIWIKEFCFYFFAILLDTEFYKNYSTLAFNKTFSWSIKNLSSSEAFFFMFYSF